MKQSKLKSLAAAVALSVAASGASADMLTAELDDGTKLSMFGILDIGLMYQDKVTSADADSKIDLQSSGMRQSIIGWKGSRPMFNGWNVFFNLEAHFQMDTGMFQGTGDATGTPNAGDASGRLLFRRQANLGMSGDWGTVIVGRQYGPALLAHLASEPRVFRENFSQLYGWAYSQLFTNVNAAAPDGTGGGRNTNNDVGIFMKDAVQYRNNWHGLDFGILYSFGGVEGAIDENNIWTMGASYPIGNFTLTGHYTTMSDQDTDEDVIENHGLGLAYNWNAWTFRFNYFDAQNQNAAGVETLDMTGLGFGAEWAWNERNTLIIAFYNNEDDVNAGGTGGDAETNSFVLSNDYAIAPSTTLYSVLSVVDVDSGMGTVANFATSIVDNPAPPGETTTYINVGVNYQF